MLESQAWACPRDHTAHDLWNLLETLHSSGMLSGEQASRKQATESRRWRYQTFQDREALEREEGRGHLRGHAAFESTPNVEMELFEDMDGRRWKSSQCGWQGVNSFIQRVNRETWTPKVAPTLTNLLTGSRWTRALPESMVNTGSHRTAKGHSSSTCGWAGAWLEWSVLRITGTHTSGGLE